MRPPRWAAGLSTGKVAQAAQNFVRLKIERFAHRGEAIGHLDGLVVFVVGAIPGEEVVVDIFQRKPDYLRGRLLEVVTPSPDRTVPPCPYFGVCGGCQLQHVTYNRQLALKQAVVSDQLRRLGGFAAPPVRPTLGMDVPWLYRNHARFSALYDGTLGFTMTGSRRLLKIGYCLLMHQKINEALALLHGHCRKLHNVSIRYGFHTGQLLVAPRIQAVEPRLPTGQAYYEEELHGRRFRIAAASFFQVNTPQAETLAQLVLERLALPAGGVLVDAYCGVGTFGILAAEQAGRVIGIEESAAALADARHNARGLANVTFHLGAVEDVLPALGERIDAVVIDPPRAGCRPQVLAALAELRPSRIVYVSCDSATLARDLRILVGSGCELLEVQPVDMFPQTFHVENVATLAWR